MAVEFPCFLPRGAGWGPPVSGRYRFNHVARRGMAIHSARPLCGTHRIARPTDRNSVRSLSQPLDQTVESEEYFEWVALLKSCAAFEAYCKTYRQSLGHCGWRNFCCSIRNSHIRFAFPSTWCTPHLPPSESDRTQSRAPGSPGRTATSYLEFQSDRRNHGVWRNCVRGQRALAVRASSRGNPSGVFRLFRGIALVA